MSTLSDQQEKAISIVPIPVAVLSIFGSISIIQIACRNRKSKKWTPYTRLLIAISCCDIIYSITMAVSGFMLPRETSHRIWAIGNGATCTALGFFSQFFVSVLAYHGMLSVYFLLSARYRISNDDIARKYEPWMHLISLGYPVLMGVIGVSMGVFHENELGQGCWVNNYPENCGEEPGQPTCQTAMLGWIFGGGITVLAFGGIVANNLAILLYVRRQTMIKIARKEILTSPQTKVEPENGGKALSSGETQSSNSNEEEETEVDQPRQLASALRKDQLKRLKLVASQAFLYVAAFLLTTSWTGLLQGIQSISYTTDVNLTELEVKLYPVLVLQAFFLPLQGNVYKLPPSIAAKKSYFDFEPTLLFYFLISRRSLCQVF